MRRNLSVAALTRNEPVAPSLPRTRASITIRSPLSTTSAMTRTDRARASAVRAWRITSRAVRPATPVARGEALVEVGAWVGGWAAGSALVQPVSTAATHIAATAGRRRTGLTEHSTRVEAISPTVAGPTTVGLPPHCHAAAVRLPRSARLRFGCRPASQHDMEGAWVSPKTAGDRAAARWSTASPAPLEFDILGPVRARRGGQELDLGPAKQRAVLAVLLLEANRPVPADRIVAAVWGGEPPANGANVAQKYVAGLRWVLERDRSPRTPGRLLRLHPAGYQLTVEPGGLDVDTFTTDVQQATAAAEAGSLDEAVGLVSAALRRCRGEPLAGLSGPVFDSARNRLVERRAAALELRADLLLRCGQHADLVADLVRLVEEFPLREQLRCLYMLALYRSGRQAEALAAYADARHRLVAEFGVEPGEALRRLHTRILRSDPELTGPEPASSIPDTGAPPVAAHAGP